MEEKSMGTNLGFRINERTSVVSEQTIARFVGLPVANVSDCMSRMTAGGSRLLPMHAGGNIAGPALTVKTRPGDNLMVHKALDLATPGDIIVVDAGGDLTNAIIGEIMIAYAITRQIGGFIINGAVRDIDAIRAGDFPVYAAGITHRGPYKDGPGEINVPIAIDGMVIEPGDLIIGDGDGFLSIPKESAEAIADKAFSKQEDEKKAMEAIAAHNYDRRWIDATLKRLNCAIPGV
jgi:regulator of RNase E activity RraA